MKRRMMLYFGSFNPIHKGHVALAERVIGLDLCDEVALVVSPQNPYKDPSMLAPETERFEMAEIACKASAYPERIRPSVIEFLLPRPSYTIDTLQYLSEHYGEDMEFSVLMGSDQLERLDGWKAYRQILAYPVYVYPRKGYLTIPTEYAARITFLENAPMLEVSSTEIRRRIESGEDTADWLHPDVAAYIRQKGLWSPASRLAALTARLAEKPDDVALLLEHGKLHYRLNEWGAALNDFNRILRIDAAHIEARQFVEMIQEILAFRYKDIYNP